MNKKGFTLIELMIVIAIIAIIAAIAIPGLLRSRIGANETSAIGSMKTVTAGEEQFRSQACVDEDSDGVGEYGTIGELSGNDNYRDAGVGAGVNCSTSPFIPTVFAPDANGYAQKSGYIFTIFVSSAAAALWTAASTSNLPGNYSVAADNNEEDFIALAWPSDYGKSGNRCFALNSQGQIMQNANSDQKEGTAAATPMGIADALTGANFIQATETGAMTSKWAPIG
jgi:prepilin-type N-terminal cleavage/methylation domain-containing protein